MSTTALPRLEMDVLGSYEGNAYPEQAEYRIVMTRDDSISFDVEDSSGSPVAPTLVLTEELADGIICMAGTDHSLSGYEDDWALPAGLDRQISWTLQTNLDVSIVLRSDHLDEIAAWLRYAIGEDVWDGDDEWEY